MASAPNLGPKNTNDPAWKTRLKLGQARQTLKSALGEVERALARHDHEILFHVHIHHDNLAWPARRSLDFVRDAIASAHVLSKDAALRRMARHLEEAAAAA